MTSYFIAKVNNFAALQKCIADGKWACKKRVIPPHPNEILKKSFQSGRVLIIYSVINNHGWHGIAEMKSLPSVRADTQEDGGEGNHYENASDHEWHYFDVEWLVNFLEFGEQCVSFALTEDITCCEHGNIISVNKSRNWQKIDSSAGQVICELIQNQFKWLCSKQQEKLEKQQEKLQDSFYKTNDTTISTVDMWERIVGKVEAELGKVVLACPFGSQRYAQSYSFLLHVCVLI